MANYLQRLTESSFGIRLVSALGQGLPLQMGYRLADFVAATISTQKNSKMVRAVRTNQWVVRGETAGSGELDQVVVETFQQMARSVFDLYHYARNVDAARRLLVLDTATQALLQRPEFNERGLVIAGLHISNFDLALQTLVRMGLKLLVLTIPNPQGGRQIEFEMRRQAGMNLLPASVDSFRHALKYLQRGGIVLTGIDRPVEGMDIRPRFFGRPAMLPTHHIFLAAKARVPVMLISTHLRPDGKYQIFTSDRIELDHDPDREKGMKLNAEKVLQVAEGFVRRAPQQWSMSLPVWPEALDLVPG